MAIRLEKSGGLILIHGAPDPPSKKWWDKKPRGLGLWIVLALFIAGLALADSVAPEWPAIAETVKGLLASAR